MDHQATLNQLATRFQLIRLPNERTPLEPSFAIQPPTELLADGTLSLPETVEEVTQVPGLPTNYDFTFVVKQVRFLPTDPLRLAPDPLDEDPIGGLPIADRLVLPTGAINNQIPPNTLMFSEGGQGNVAGIPGLLSRIKGTIQPMIERVTESIRRLPINISVRWRVYDDNNPSRPFASGLQYQINAGGWTNLPAGLLEVGAARSPGNLTLRFPILFTNLTSAIPEVRRFTVQVSIKLSLTVAPAPANPIETGWVDLPPVPLEIPTVPIPTMVVMFENQDFTGRAFVCVPKGFLVGAAPGVSGAISIGSALGLAASILGTLAPGNPLPGFLTSATGTTVASLAPSPGQVIVAAENSINDLDVYVFDPGGLFGIGRIDAEDFARSVVCIGPPGTVFDMFYDEGLRERITRFQVTIPPGTVSSLGIAIRALVANDPSTTGDVTYGGTITSFSPGRVYDQQTSSLQIIPV